MGVSPTMTDAAANRVRLVNKIGIIVPFLIGIPFTVNLVVLHGPISVIIALWSVCLPAFFTPWVNKYLSATAGKAMAVILFNLGTLLVTLLTANGQNHLIDFLLSTPMMLVATVMPVLFYEPHQRKQRVIGIVFTWICYVSYNY